MMTQALLIELLTEELPPKALKRLGEAFAEQISKGLESHDLLASLDRTSFATPRRLAVCFEKVRSQAPDKEYAKKLMPVSVGLDATGEATPALLKKLQALGLADLPVSSLSKESDGKQDYLYAKGVAQGAQLVQVIQEVIEQAMQNLPIPKVMRYQLSDGQTSVKFVRPVHGLVVLYVDQVLPVTVLGMQSSQNTLGHRFLSKGSIRIERPEQYAHQLEAAKVIASYDERKARILLALNEAAHGLGLTIGQGEDVDNLLDEVTALVEYPAVYIGQFDERFLEVPAECLTLTMRLNQKYFPLFDQQGKLSHHFLIVSNMAIENPQNIIEGNEKVIRPRLADAEFFFHTDRKQTLESRVALLKSIIYHNKLGTQYERVIRLVEIAKGLAVLFGSDEQLAQRAAYLAKADLTSNMVGEFPELQGVMGAYYAAHDKEPDSVQRALRYQYQVRYEEAIEPQDLTAAILFIAERLETLVGIWGIGLQPTGERDPFGLRRAALGLVSAFERMGFLGKRLDLTAMLQIAFASFKVPLLPNTVAEVHEFILERYRHLLLAQQYPRLAVDAVLAVDPPIVEIEERLKAIVLFEQLPEAQSLAAANKRITNLLKKVEVVLPVVDETLLTEAAELALYRQLQQCRPEAEQAMSQGAFTEALQVIASTHQAVDTFFNDVMVMAEDLAVRHNRLALLSELHQMMNLVADISRLAS